MQRLIVTADDCGMSEGINQATYDLHKHGYISAASVMTNFPGYRHALERFSDCPELDVGAHLTLTDGSPVDRRGPRHPHLLKDDHSFRDKFSLYLRGLFFSKDTIRWIRNELDAQLRRLVDAGVQPQHISTHHHFHSLPILRDIVHELAAVYQVDWVRGHSFRATISPHAILPRQQGQSQRYAFFMPDYMTGIQGWISRSPAEFADRVASLSGTVEIVAHPGTAKDPDFPMNLGYGPAPRYAETKYLIEALELLKERGITP
ncbi:MAG: ChbG/HpnK family deacetylase [Chloroflexi bacterium]|nr:ChbG/HpnK family deacetylase [Chloroflexota bacterium]